MVKRNNIKKSCAVFLLFVFALGTTPKKILHDIFANHKDAVYKESSGNNKVPTIRLSIIHCQCDDLVIESPYIPGQETCYIVTSVVYPGFINEPVVHLFSALHFCSNLRGPPAINA